jgi:uncharacterized protein YbjT (DUF2867 family)
MPMECALDNKHHGFMTNFLLLGGTGKVGRRLAAALREQDQGVRVASRGEQGDVVFDWNNTATWASALADVDGIFVVGPGSATDWSPKLRDLEAAAAQAGVRHAVLLSARGVEFHPDGAVARAEKALRTGPLAWTILRPTHFAQNFTEAMFVPDANGEVRAPVGDARHPFVDVQDIAAVAAAALTSVELDGKVIDISGPEAVPFAAAAQAVGGTYVPESRDEHVAALRAAGTPEGYVSWRMAMLDGIARGDDAYISDGVLRVLGRPATPLRTALGD